MIRYTSIPLKEIRSEMLRSGYDEFSLLAEVPPPYPFGSCLCVFEAVRGIPLSADQERSYLLFISTPISDLHIRCAASKAEYEEWLHRRGYAPWAFHAARAEGRRRLAAKLLSGNADPYQLLLPAIADDDYFRTELTSRDYRLFLAKPETRAVLTKPRMSKLHQLRRQQARSVAIVPLPPATTRGLRSRVATRRRFCV